MLNGDGNELMKMLPDKLYKFLLGLAHIADNFSYLAMPSLSRALSFSVNFFFHLENTSFESLIYNLDHASRNINRINNCSLNNSSSNGNGFRTECDTHRLDVPCVCVCACAIAFLALSLSFYAAKYTTSVWHLNESNDGGCVRVRMQTYLFRPWQFVQYVYTHFTHSDFVKYSFGSFQVDYDILVLFCFDYLCVCVGSDCVDFPPFFCVIYILCYSMQVLHLFIYLTLNHHQKLMQFGW